jgi:hypothetical protein
VRDRPAITCVALAIVCIIIFSTVLVAGLGSIQPREARTPTVHMAVATSVPSTTPSYPTIVHQQLSSATTTITTTIPASTELTTADGGNGNCTGQCEQQGQYGQIGQHGQSNRNGGSLKHQTRINANEQVTPVTTTVTVIEIVDQVTITAVHGVIPGHMDKIVLQGYFGSTTPYCVLSTTFDATGLTTYTTTFRCQYMGAGTYYFKVQVFDDNGTLIGDPMGSLSL